MYPINVVLVYVYNSLNYCEFTVLTLFGGSFTIDMSVLQMSVYVAMPFLCRAHRFKITSVHSKMERMLILRVLVHKADVEDISNPDHAKLESFAWSGFWA